MSKRQQLASARRWVIKIGSALLTNEGRGLNLEGISRWVEQMVQLRAQGIELVLVSSGAVAEGLCRLGWKERPSELHKLQAAAAVGQMGLVQAYESRFQQHNMHTAQILLTHDDLSNRQRYLNARTTLRTLLSYGVVPVVNENDTVVIDEIRFGDNDTLAALVANLIEAEHLIILTDQNGMYDKDPRANPDAKLLTEVLVTDPSLEAMASGGAGALGRGGMLTKVRAARLAARSGASTVVAPGRLEDVLLKIRRSEEVGTFFVAQQAPVTARKQWLAGHLQLRGQLVLDAGATRVLRESGKSLLAVGVRDVRGKFQRGEVVACIDENGREIARGLINYSHAEVEKIKGQPSERIESILGYVDEPELIHRDNLVLV
ncbi:MAG: glutamate 5-kinase [Gammaproteobacteria bacterium]|nr:glutamate 5-kinase [Gammaproteobacteria bacterium]MDH5651169.1 glutamate 5-kinase [Gammaproteobacteria bacterium]